MSNTVLPLKAILQGDHRALVQALREVAQQDNAVCVHKTPLSLQSLRQKILEFSVDNVTGVSQRKHSLLEHFFATAEHGDNVYRTDTPIPLLFADKIVTALFLDNKAHRDIEVAITRFSLLMITALAQRNEAITDPQHPLRKCIEMVFLQASVWESSGGKPGKQFPSFLHSILDNFDQFDIQSNETWQTLIRDLEGFQKANQVRTANLEKRLRDSLDVDPEQQKQQQVVSRWINRKLNGKPLPDEIALFVRLHLIGDMQYLLIHSPEQTAAWSHWQKLLHVLSWVFKESSDPDFNNKVKNVLIPIVEELDERYYQGVADPEKYQTFIPQLTTLLIERLQGQSINCRVFEGQEIEESAAVVKQAVIQDHKSFNEGQWYLFYREDDDTLRAKLILKSVKTDTLVFANYLGKKVHESDFENFALQLAAHSAIAINQDQLFKHALYQALKKLELLHRRNLAKQQQVEDAREAARSQAAAKALDEARAIEKRQAEERLEEQRHVQQRSKLQPQALEVYENTIKNLQVGAWVAITQSDGSVSNAKLSVKLASTNRYVFTDRLGQPTGDLTLDELIDLMIDKRLEILSGGENFENKLEQIVKGLRRA